LTVAAAKLYRIEAYGTISHVAYLAGFQDVVRQDRAAARRGARKETR